ncbi:MAG TPA: helix-hairpin-helix domain-containing protein [Bacteroidales bacterium]|nr:helix-hairpin-helix domain-containing protein [Bacteroidales bacterium]
MAKSRNITKEIRDFVTFSKKDMRGITLLGGLLILLIVVRLMLPSFIQEREPDLTEFEKLALAFEKARHEAEAARHGAREAVQTAEAIPASERLKPFLFDPNTTSKEAWQKLGLSLRQIGNIERYLAAGGRFRVRNDFGKLFTITEEEFALLKPFILLPESLAEPERDKPSEQIKIPEPVTPILLDINKADSAELTKLKGIGPVFARRIIRYRNQLGGFHHPSQLLEVFGLDSARLTQFAHSLIFDETTLQKVNVNSASIEELRKHPYIDHYLAKSIIDQRIRLGKFSNPEQLKGLPLMHRSLYEKLTPYLNFSNNNE